MRSISLVQKIEFDYRGSVFQNAVCLVDIDNDGNNELCISNSNGDLHVFKGIRSTKPWKVNKNMGSIVVLCGGAVRDMHENVLCSLDTDGTCHLFDVHDDSTIGNEMGGFKSSSRASAPSRAGELRLMHHQRLSPNAKVAILEDIDNDGSAELIVGYTDRFVRVYKWQTIEEDNDCYTTFSSHKNPLVKKGSNSKEESERKSSKQTTLVKQGSKEDNNERKPTLSFTLSLSKDKTNSSSTPKTDTNQMSNDTKMQSQRPPSASSVHAAGSFVLVKQFALLAQVGSIAVCKTVDGKNQLIVSQPNGGYCILGVYDNEKGFSDAGDTPTSLDSPNTLVSESYPSFFPITSKAHRQSMHVNTEIVGGIKRQDDMTGVIGLCTQDGNFITLDNTSPGLDSSSSSNPIKNHSSHRWFSMSKLDVTKNGDDEIVLCAMDGMTYIIDKKRDIVSFNFNENVAAFTAGYYGVEDTSSTPCLCYVSLSGKIYLYYNVWINTMKVKCVHGALIEKIQQREDLKYILEMFKLPNGAIDHQKIQNLVKHIWAENVKS